LLVCVKGEREKSLHVVDEDAKHVRKVGVDWDGVCGGPGGELDVIRRRFRSGWQGVQHGEFRGRVTVLGHAEENVREGYVGWCRRSVQCFESYIYQRDPLIEPDKTRPIASEE